MKNIAKLHFGTQAGKTVLLIVMAVVFAFSSVIAPRFVGAQNNLQDQVNALERENEKNQRIVADLMATATSYENAIETLQKQINQLQNEINKNEAEKARLEKEIAELQLELERQKLVLGENIKAMYVGGEMTTLEMLATSNDLSEFVDKEAYRNAVQQKIQDTMERIALLQNDLNTKKQMIEGILAVLQSKRTAVNTAKAEQSRLLAMNKQQQESFNAKTRNNEEKIAELRRKIEEQRRLNNQTVYTDGGLYFLRFSGSVSDFSPYAYPYKNAGFSMRPEGCGYYDPNTGQTDSMDRWGYCTRQCVSFTAWAVEASGRNAPMWYGNAKNWVNAAYRDGVTVSRTPRAGDVAISTRGTYGHAMYVRSVSGNQFNAWEYNQQLDGRLRTDRWITYR